MFFFSTNWFPNEFIQIGIPWHTKYVGVKIFVILSDHTSVCSLVRLSACRFLHQSFALILLSRTHEFV